MSTRNKAELLDKTLFSIFRQSPGFDFEVIVTDDGSTDNTVQICEKYPIKYYYLESTEYRNPSKARNNGYRNATGEIIICQSDDVVHLGLDTIHKLCYDLQSGTFLIAEVWNGYLNKITNDYTDWKKCKGYNPYTGQNPKHARPFFFLGSLLRSDLYKIGGNDEEFIYPAYDDNWFADCLINGLGLYPVFSGDILGLHQAHSRPDNLATLEQHSLKLYHEKLKLAREGIIKWEASSGPW